MMLLHPLNGLFLFGTRPQTSPNTQTPKHPNTPNGKFDEYEIMKKTQAGVHIVFFGAGGLFGCLFGDFTIPKHAFSQIDTEIRKTVVKTKNREIIKEIAVSYL